MPRYAITGGTVTVKARSSIHDTTCVWSKLDGTIDFDPAAAQAGAQADVRVDMRAYDTGDRLKNWKLKGDLQADRHPTALFRLARLESIKQDGDHLSAEASGAIDWRSRQATIRARGTATATPAHIDARATFELDVRHLDVEPPKILMFKVDPVVTVEVHLTASR